MKRKRPGVLLSAASIIFAAAISAASCKKAEGEIAFAEKFAGQADGYSGQDDISEEGETEEPGKEPPSNAAIEEEYPLLRWEEGNDCFGRDEYIFLEDMEAERHYQVKKGDTLWGIARDFYGEGKGWPVLMRANAQQIQDENLIYPDMELVVPDGRFIRKQRNSRGGFSSLACSYDAPRDWVAGRPSWEICLEYSWYPEEGNYGVYTHVTQNRLFPDGAGDAWEDIKQEIMQASQESSTVLFSAPVFERYKREDGRELLFYHFVAMAGDQNIQFAVAYVPGETYLAEFIGICPLAAKEGGMCDIVGITRYMAASYREEGGEKTWDSLKYRPYLGADSWPFEDLHNPFAIAASRFGTEAEAGFEGTDREVRFVSKEWEDLLRKMICYHFDYSDEQIGEFMERPVYLSELAWIEEVELTESPIPGRDSIVIQGLCPAKETECADYHLTTLADIAVLPNLQRLTLEIGTATDYEALAACPSLRELSIAGEGELREASWLLELPNLESLTYNVSYIPHLLDMGIELEDGTTFSKGASEQESETPKEAERERKTVEEILSQCTSLTYLELEYTGEMDYSFLEKLPELYTFILSGEEENGTRQERFTENSFPQMKCLVVDGQWLRNPA